MPKKPACIVDPVAFRKIVYAYFRKNGRDLPWRREIDPYRVFVSEVMLQQTQVDRVASKFETFVGRFPDFASLAAAPLREVLAAWQGLGYNRRALNLKRAAEIVTTEHRGVLPSSPDLLVALPGIGKATAASIAAFAYNEPTVFLETNIRTVLIHHFFADREAVSDEELLPLAEAVLDRKNARKWYSALMDYGTALKKLHGNLSRRSAGYATQTRFQGSRRQKRGMILKLLLEKGAQGPKAIAAELGIEADLLDSILPELAAEGLVRSLRGRYLIG